KYLFPDVATDVSRSNGRGRLSNVRLVNGVHFGRLDVEMNVKLVNMPGIDLPFDSGGVVQITAQSDEALEADHEAGKWTMEHGLGARAGRRRSHDQGLDRHPDEGDADLQGPSPGEVRATALRRARPRPRAPGPAGRSARAPRAP